MIMNILICGENELLRFIRSGKELYSHCISITNPGKDTTRLIRGIFKAVLSLSFLDDDQSPRMSDIKKLIDFYTSTKAFATGYVVHCHRGVSRSTAIALCLMYLALGSEDESIAKLLEVTRSANPNARILQLFDEHTGSHLSKTKHKLDIERLRIKFSRPIAIQKPFNKE